MRLKPINQQAVAVVGASSGIGRATALGFARRGAKLVVAARGDAGLQSLVEEIRQEGGEAIAVTADALDFDQMKRVAERAVEEYGRLDTWVHAAAVSVYATFAETTPEEFKHVIETNLTGQAYGAMAALPHLRREGRGALIHISSVEARRALPYQSAYAASKHGIKGFLDALRMELAREGAEISVTEILPSGINTPFFNKARTRLGVKPRPVPPVYQPQLVADAILYAAEKPTPEIVVGGAGRMLVMSETISPRLTDAVLSLVAFKGQRTDEPKPEDAPDNFYQPLDGFDYVEGDFGDEARATSAYTWLARHGAARSVIAVAALGAGVVLAARVFGREKGRNAGAEGADENRRAGR